MTSPTDELAAIERGTDAATALRLFDALPAAGIPQVIGAWRGRGLPTGHPFDGMLERFGWHGKRFEGPDDAHPLVFERRGRRFEVDPAFVPMGLLARHPGWFANAAMARAFALSARLIRTDRPRARLRMIEHRGVVSAAMIYDRLPILDAFRRVDDDTLIGVMDLRGVAQPFVFVLRREP